MNLDCVAPDLKVEIEFSHNISSGICPDTVREAFGALFTVVIDILGNAACWEMLWLRSRCCHCVCKSAGVLGILSAAEILIRQEGSRGLRRHLVDSK